MCIVRYAIHWVSHRENGGTLRSQWGQVILWLQVIRFAWLQVIRLPLRINPKKNLITCGYLLGISYPPFKGLQTGSLFHRLAFHRGYDLPMIIYDLAEVSDGTLGRDNNASYVRFFVLWSANFHTPLGTKKMNEWHLKGTIQNGKDCFPFPSFFRGKLAVSFPGCIDIFV